MEMAWGYAPPLIIEAAIRNKVFDSLDAEAKTAAEVASAAGASVRGVTILMNALTGLNLLEKDGAGRYSLTPESATFLVSTKPSFLGGLARHTSTQLIPKWLSLTEIVRSGKPARGVNEQETGSEFFEQFVEDIFPMSYPSAQLLAETLGLAQATKPVKVLDLAAGSGVWGIALAQSSPQVRVTAVDWPKVLPVTQRVAQRFGLSDRFQFVAGDLSTANFGTGYDVATLGHILHSEGEQASIALLKKGFEALSPGGTIAIAEFLVDEERATSVMGLIFAVNMLVNTTNGNTFTFNEIGGWLRDAGFSNVRSVDSPGPSPLILATKPEK
jgi:precorrin-6B methylase 2